MSVRRIRDQRVRFGMGYPARMVAIDGTWFRDCYLQDVSETGAKVTVKGELKGLNLSEFFLALSHTGNAYRKYQMVWTKGETIGVQFGSSKSSMNYRPNQTAPVSNPE